jgi:aryl-alcohol dehydrogenase-like predicted oxidoreductase
MTKIPMREPLQISPLGFGCAPIMGKIGKTQALRAMAIAFDLDIKHFDIARSYGFGQAESILGHFIKGRRGVITITSKFGVVPPKLSLRTRALIPIARSMTHFMPQLKTRLKRKSGQLLSERCFATAYAQQCLHTTLTELGTDYLDIYLLHEPESTQIHNIAEISEFMETNINAGKILRWGFAYGKVEDFGWAGNFASDILQFEGNIQTLPTCSSLLQDKKQHLVTRPFLGGQENQSSLMLYVQNLNLEAELQAINARITDLALCLSLNMAQPNGSVICSMFTAKHIQNNIKTLTTLANKPEMQEIVAKIKAHLTNDHLF